MGFRADRKMECGTSISVQLAAVCAILAVALARKECLVARSCQEYIVLRCVGVAANSGTLHVL